MITKDPHEAIDALRKGERFVLFNGDCFEFLGCCEPNVLDLIVTSPPYFMGKEYELSHDVREFSRVHAQIAPLITKCVRDGGNIAWQVGSHVHNSKVTPLDFLVYNAFSVEEELFLRNRIVWTFGHGAHAKKRFSGRHETILWYSKGENHYFDLDSVRVPQKYPGKRHYKGPKKGEWSGHPLGKNPTDIWDIPNVKSNHIEKTAHPCQFPIALCERLILALSAKDGTVCDPYAGSGSAGVAAVKNGRRFIGCEMKTEYCEIAEERYREFAAGRLKVRPLEQEVFKPRETSAVATRPPHFQKVKNG